MNSTYRLCDAIFGSRGSRLEVDMNAAGKRERSGMKRYELVLDNARRRGSITAKQKKAITEIFSATIAGRIGSLWSTGIASSIDKYTRNSEKPIVAELRVQGGAGHRRKIYSGRIYFDCKDESSLEYLSRVVFEGTDLIKKSGLQWTDASDRAVIKAVVAGLFTRPRMADWIAVDVQEGANVEASPRCISESKLREIQHKEKAVAAEQARLAEIERTNQLRRHRFIVWARKFIQDSKIEKEKNEKWDQLAEEVVDDWESLCD